MLAELGLQVFCGLYQQPQKIMKGGPYVFSAFQWCVAKTGILIIVSTSQP